MLDQLGSLISGKVRKPLVLNGQLVMDGQSLVTVHRDNYAVAVTKMIGGSTEVEVKDPEALLASYADAFNKKYSGVASRGDGDLVSFYANVDPFTGAVVLKNGLYQKLLDRGNDHHFHDGRMQFKPEIQSIVTEFNKEFILNYFEIYSYLFNRRLMSSHMSVKVKGHLVAGLFQPLVVRTRHIDCPMELPEFQWFFDYLNSPGNCEKQLESVQETVRGLQLTAIAMSDFSAKFGTPCVKEFNRLYFQFILYTILLDTLAEGSASLMPQKFKKIYRTMQAGRGDAANALPFFTACIDGIKACRRQIAVRM